MSIGERIKELRIRNKQSLQEVATGVGASKAHIWELERGGAKNPSMELVTKLAKHFRVSVAYLAEETPPSEEQTEIMVLYRDLKNLNERDRETIRQLMERLKDRKEGD